MQESSFGDVVDFQNADILNLKQKTPEISSVKVLFTKLIPGLYCLRINFYLAFLGDIVNESFCIFPSKTWVCNRAAWSHMIADVLTAFEEVAFDHNAFDQFFEVRVVVAAVEYFCNDADLFFVLFVGVGVVGIYDNSRVLEIFLGI